MRILTTQAAYCAMFVCHCCLVSRVLPAASAGTFDILYQVEEDPFDSFDVENGHVILLQNNELVAVDFTSPSRPTEVSRVPLYSSGGAYPDVRVDGTNVYTIHTEWPAGDFRATIHAYDFSSPTLPNYVGNVASAQLGYSFDANYGKAMAVEDDRLYLGGFDLRIMDVGDPSSPVLLARHPFRCGMLAVDQGRIVLAHERDGAPAVYDMENPIDPKFLGNLPVIGEPEAVAIQWPRCASALHVASGSVYPRPGVRYLTWYGLYEYSADQDDWTEAGEYFGGGHHELRSLTFFGNTFIALHEDGRLMSSDWTGEHEIPGIPGGGRKIRLENDRLYWLDDNQLSVLQPFGEYPLEVKALGAWQTMGGSVLAQGPRRLYVLGTARNVTVVDISDPFGLRVTGYGPPTRNPRSAEVYQGHLYVADGEAGVRVFSLLQPDDPVEITTPSLRLKATDLAIDDGMLYVSSDYDRLRVYDLADPTNPPLLGHLRRLWGDFDGARVLDVADGYAYVAEGNRLAVVDARDPSSPTVRNAIDATWFVDVAVRGNRLFGLGRTGYSNPNTGLMFDVSTPTVPTRIAAFASGRSMAVSDYWAYVAGGDPHGLCAYGYGKSFDAWYGGSAAGAFADVVIVGELVCAISESDGLLIARHEPPAPKPDLTIADFGWLSEPEGLGQPVTFTGRIVNGGFSAALEPIWVRISGKYSPQVPAMPLCGPIIIPAGLAPESAARLEDYPTPLLDIEPGVYFDVKAEVDWGDRIEEMVESNNTAAADRTFAVNLDIKPVSFDFGPNRVSSNQAITLSGEIDFFGVVPTRQTFKVAFICSSTARQEDPTYEICDPLFVPRGQAPGTTYRFSIERTVPAPPQGPPSGKYFAGIRVDSQQQVFETDEGNNLLWHGLKRISINMPARAQRWPLYR